MADTSTTNPGEVRPVHERRSIEWRDHYMRYRFLMDSYEGGDSYRRAIYGVDFRGLPVRNLVRHKREYPDPREQPYLSGYGFHERAQSDDPSVIATDDDYQMRLARTPVPTFMAEAIETHLARVYADEPEREPGSAAVKAWWADVDGRGTTIGEWMSSTVAPLLMAFGCLDLICDHPKAPDGETVSTRADQIALRLDRCVANYILPENMVWWKLDETGTRYRECLVCELQDDESHSYRHWTADGWTLYDSGGKVTDTGTHPFGRPPIVRVFDRRRPRCKHVGLPRYESIAEIQREFYNRDSELILSDTTQAHPLLQGPEDYVQADGAIPIGPSWLLPMKKDSSGASVQYTGFQVVEFPKGGAESLRTNKQDLRDQADRAALLTKPAGAHGHGGSTVAQSGVSKRLDAAAGNDLLGKIARRLRAAEMSLVELALLVLGDGTVDQAALDATEVNYATEFDLLSPEEVAAGLLSFQDALDRAGACPETEGAMLRRLARQLLPGLSDDEYAEHDAEIEAHLEAAAADRAAARAAAAEPGAGTSDGPIPPDVKTSLAPAESPRLAGAAELATEAETGPGV